MSLLSLGQRCSACSLVDFLPLTCPSCDQVFCRDHIHSHSDICQSTSTIDENEYRPQAGPSRKKDICEVGGCTRPRIEAIAGLELAGPSSGEKIESIAKEVRCSACGGAYCVQHRDQISHSCSGPLQHNARQDALIARREKARTIIAERFPEQAARIAAIPKPPPQRDVVKPKDKAMPSLEAKSSTPSTPTAPARSSVDESNGQLNQVSGAEKKVKSKAEKLHDLHIRKLRSLAKPLEARMASREKDPRVFFEWAVDETGSKISEWKGKGKWDGKTERVWVPSDTPLGRIFDLLITQSKTARPKDPSDDEQALSLLCLAAPPDTAPSIKTLSLSSPASEIAEGSLVVLIRGWRE